MSVGLLSVGLLSVGLLSVDLLSVGLLKQHPQIWQEQLLSLTVIGCLDGLVSEYGMLRQCLTL